MLHTQQKYTGTQYTMAVALLVVALVVIPAVLMLSHPFGFMAASTAGACSAFCVILAWVQWKSRSERTIPSIAAPFRRGK